VRQCLEDPGRPLIGGLRLGAVNLIALPDLLEDLLHG
jgi:hypothetical protein